ncbi:uncharacterized protein BDW43DRAFT_226084 [Aspergillus alliaceus]|uniref:uncharacterized protein n=1 Tax=Petromyces alliaceus TaxID=209559 RepID=UPI0012A56E0D|nr:uncharacterized protein BDW43DRAFT_226084 [Aspergillus alliaceus]KAB8236825.1 hypothetical protein BDW43DRAFT_226084 [Aspergillus alliaceus]
MRTSRLANIASTSHNHNRMRFLIFDYLLHIYFSISVRMFQDSIYNPKNEVTNKSNCWH